MTSPCVELFPINTHRADASADTDNRCRPRCVSGPRRLTPCRTRIDTALPALLYTHEGLVCLGVGGGGAAKLPGNSPRWTNRRCYNVNWLSKRFCHLPFSPVFKDADTLCFGYRCLVWKRWRLLASFFSFFSLNSFYPFKCSLKC